MSHLDILNPTREACTCSKVVRECKACEAYENRATIKQKGIVGMMLRIKRLERNLQLLLLYKAPKDVKFKKWYISQLKKKLDEMIA